MLTVPSPSHAKAIAARVDQVERCTGGEVELIDYEVTCIGIDYCGGFRGLFEVGQGALDDASGASVYDSYMTQAMDVPLLNEYVEDLSPWISKTPELRWNDLLPLARELDRVGSKQSAMPFDLDFMNLLFRSDLVEAYTNETGLPEPRTFEELAAFAEHWFGRDLNGDGEADFGILSLIHI